MPPRTRNDVGLILEALGFTTGVELGVQTGAYASILLSTWPSCTKCVLVMVHHELGESRRGAHLSACCGMAPRRNCSGTARPGVWAALWCWARWSLPSSVSRDGAGGVPRVHVMPRRDWLNRVGPEPSHSAHRCLAAEPSRGPGVAYGQSRASRYGALAAGTTWWTCGRTRRTTTT